MHLTIGFLVVGSLAWQAIAAPAYPPVLEYIISEQAPSWNAGAVDEYPIHTSCNATERVQLRQALAETVALADHAKEHVLRWGNSSEHYRRYFGDQPTSQVVGNLDKIVSSDKGGVLFRCDNPDGNCQLEGMTFHR